MTSNGKAGTLPGEDAQALSVRDIRAERGIFLIARNEYRVVRSYTAVPVWQAVKRKNTKREEDRRIRTLRNFNRLLERRMKRSPI
jgi:hypothetical protein